ncbi:MAG: DUF4256 domain-containing protein [Pedobacter sp.]|nr:MAG: DUF4256 domain-containing protein [Pedobacter sp.]
MSIKASAEFDLLEVLAKRFQKNMHRHPSLNWSSIAQLLKEKPSYLDSLLAMEDSGGEPDVVQFSNPLTPGIYFVDWAKESPKGRRCCCFDHESRVSRKEYPPQTSALELAADMGVEILNAEEYQFLQSLEAFDMKTSSWIATPDPIRDLGGALFSDRRYEHVFVYHNGASSYYAARGFRAKLKIAS